MYFVVYTSRALLKFDGDFAPDLGTEDIPADIVSEKDFLVSDCHKSRPSLNFSSYRYRYYNFIRRTSQQTHYLLPL